MKWIFSRLGYIWAALTAAKGQRRPQPTGSQPTPVSEPQEQPGAQATPVSRPQPSTASKAAASKTQTPPQKTHTERRSLRRYERTLIVGVDFGTSSTKVVWQDLSENYFELFRWRPDLKGLESVLLPSTRLHTGRARIFQDILSKSIQPCIPNDR